MKLIPFDLEKALAGAEVRTGSMRKVNSFKRRDCDDYLSAFRDVYQFKAEIDNWGEASYTSDGKFWQDRECKELDLFLVEPERETIWTCGTRWPENKFARKEGV